ncbi:hypothetical protein KQI68_04775 [Peptoniphilus sp. MSJ-1]|uniref:YbbR-like protein n=1 Tax=Peptoniphilus ovalis TaxID=2841503 RepID=A0ABS6FGQ5_9FIRM|nr:CdaR family protein [Peptoniphilus ovalis]MBU5669154.1 hypothetical protein [Peptoniphilus ovalis]
MKKIDFKKDKSFAMKVLSIIFAIILWSYVRSEANFVTTMNYRGIDVTYEGLSNLKNKNLTIISPKSQTVDVKLQGYNSYMRNANRDGVSAKVDLSNLTEGEHSVPVNVSYIDLGITVTNVSPRSIPFKIDKIVEDTFDVTINTINKPEKGLSVGEISNSEQIKISGPSTVVSKISKVESVIDTAELTETSTVNAEIVAYDDTGKALEGLTMTPSTLKVEVPILKSKNVPVTLNITENSIKDGYQYKIEPNSITIRGNTDVIESINSIETYPINLDSVESRNNIRLKLPEKVSLVDENITFKLTEVQGENEIVINN